MYRTLLEIWRILAEADQTEYDAEPYRKAVKVTESMLANLDAMQAENANKEIERLQVEFQYKQSECDYHYHYGKFCEVKAELSRVEAERDAAKKEIERLRDIMRENGIMVIPSKYPGGRYAWDIRRGAQGEG